jgi:hypothetical protein
MKTASSSSVVITPAIVVLILVSAAVLFIGLTGKKLPVLSNLRIDIILLVVLGMTICTLGGIGRVAAQNAWTHPLAFLASLIGVAILIIALAAFTGWKLPLIQGDRQALIAIAILIGAKIVASIIHYMLVRS